MDQPSIKISGQEFQSKRVLTPREGILALAVETKSIKKTLSGFKEVTGKSGIKGSNP